MPTAYDIRPDSASCDVDTTPNEILHAWRRYWQRLVDGKRVQLDEGKAHLHAIEEELLARGIPVSKDE